MCPPGKVTYFFTIDKIATYAKDHLKFAIKVPQIVTEVEQYDEIKSYRMTKFNYKIVEQNAVLDEEYKSLLKT